MERFVIKMLKINGFCSLVRVYSDKNLIEEYYIYR